MVSRKGYLLFLFILISTASFSQINIAHFEQEGRMALYNQKYTEAINNLSIVIEHKHDPFEEYFYRGIAKYNLGDYRGAEYDFSKTLEIHPFYTRAFHYRGITYASLMEKGKALEDFAKALEFDPYNADVLISRGTVWLQMEKYDQAIADLNEALMITPESPIAFLNRAIAFKEKKQYVKALEDCNKALELNNFFKRAIAQRGLILYEMGWFDKALNDFNEVIKLDPENPRYYYYRALAQYQRNDIEATLQDYQKVISLNPTNALTYYNRAILYTQLNDYDKAIEDYDQVARLNPNNILTYFNRAHLYYETKMYQKAIDDYTKAIALFPKFATAYFMRAQARAQSGDRKGAAQDRQAGQQLVAQHDRQKAEKNHPMAWIDSTYFQKIIEFEADFNRSSVALVSGNKTESHIQPKALFRFAYLPRQHHDKKGMIDSFISQFNLNDTIGQRMILWNLNPETRFEQLNEARKKIDSLVTISAPNANLYLLQGAVERELQNYTSAINSFSLAMLANPNFIPAYINRAETAYTMKKEQEQNQQDIRHISLGAANSIPSPPAKQDYTKVYLDLNKAIALDNQKAITWYNRGNVSLNEKKYTDAVIDYSQALSCDNDFAEAYFNRGLTLIFLQDREKGCLDMSRAGELGIEDAYEVIRRFCK